MIRAILVDDEISGIKMLEKAIANKCPEVNVLAICKDAEEAKFSILSLKPDLVFLDISLPGKSSIDMLAELREIKFQIIFVTSYNQYITQAFKFSAIDYLLKPLDEDELAGAVNRAFLRIQEKTLNLQISTLLYNSQKTAVLQDMKICVSSSKGFQLVLLSNIIYCESEGSYTVLHLTEGQKITASKPILDFEQMLEDLYFIRVHRSYLVNINHVKEYIRGEGGQAILSNGHLVEISRRKKEMFIQRIKEQFKH